MFEWRGLKLDIVGPLLDGALVNLPEAEIEISAVDVMRIGVRAKARDRALQRIGLRFQVSGVRYYLRNGYHSWDGSWFERPGAEETGSAQRKNAAVGYAATAFLPAEDGVVVLGFERHDRFHTSFRFSADDETITVDAETLLDGTGATESETLLLFKDHDVENGLRCWSDAVAAASPLRPRTPPRITGWCSWYNHYAAIDEAAIEAELQSCVAFRDAHHAPLNVFLIDDGFTPEMGDWLDTKPQFPRGMRPLIEEIRAAGFTPGLWIAPFIVGNRSRLFAEHPDWMARDTSGAPLLAMHFYGEFRWHKRSEEYYVLDITHPAAAEYIGQVFKTWAEEWGAGYFKTDFLYYPLEHEPNRVAWHEAGLSRVQIWRRMAQVIRDNIGDALWLGCGCPLWASIGYVDAVRIGRDIGVEWGGDYSTRQMVSDLATRNHASGVLWQADPDCLLLRSNFHHLAEDQIVSRARLAAACGGVLMTSDTLSALPEDRAQLFADALGREGRPRFLNPDIGGQIALYETMGKRFAFNLIDREVEHDGHRLGPFATVELSVTA